MGLLGSVAGAAEGVPARMGSGQCLGCALVTAALNSCHRRPADRPPLLPLPATTCLPPLQGDVMKSIDAAVAAGRPARAAVVSKRSGERLTVVLRPGASDQLAPGKAIGIPNWVPSERAPGAGCHAGALPGGLDDGGDVFEGPKGTHTTPTPQLATCFWFVAVEGSPVGSAASQASSSGVAAAAVTPGGPSTPSGVAPAPRAARKALQTFFSQQQPEALQGLQMGPLVGSGSFGRGACRARIPAAWHAWLCAGPPTQPCHSFVCKQGPQAASASLLQPPSPHLDPLTNPLPPTCCCTVAVYRGMWRGSVVAVKLIECARAAPPGGSPAASSGSAVEAALAEAQLSKSLDHPSIVKVRWGGAGWGGGWVIGWLGWIGLGWTGGRPARAGVDWRSAVVAEFPWLTWLPSHLFPTPTYSHLPPQTASPTCRRWSTQ